MYDNHEKGKNLNFMMSYVTLRKMGSGEFGPFTIRPSGIFREFGLLAGEFGPQLENLPI